MTEQEYIDCQDRVRIVIIKNILSEIVPENSSVIVREDYTQVMRKLISWETKLFKAVKVK